MNAAVLLSVSLLHRSLCPGVFPINAECLYSTKAAKNPDPDVSLGFVLFFLFTLKFILVGCGA